MSLVQVPKAKIPPLASIGDLLRLYRLKALKQLSQNFLMDPRTMAKIVRHAGNIRKGEVCEVGPGPGGITRAILEREPTKLILIEKDARFLPMLEVRKV